MFRTVHCLLSSLLPYASRHDKNLCCPVLAFSLGWTDLWPRSALALLQPRRHHCNKQRNSTCRNQVPVPAQGQPAHRRSEWRELCAVHTVREWPAHTEKKTHQYYTQIMVMLYVLRLGSALLFVYWSKQSIAVVDKDDAFLAEYIPKLEWFYFTNSGYNWASDTLWLVLFVYELFVADIEIIYWL